MESIEKRESENSLFGLYSSYGKEVYLLRGVFISEIGGYAIRLDLDDLLVGVGVLPLKDEYGTVFTDNGGGIICKGFKPGVINGEVAGNCLFTTCVKLIVYLNTKLRSFVSVAGEFEA